MIVLECMIVFDTVTNFPSMVIEAYNFFVNLQNRFRLDNTASSGIDQSETILEYSNANSQMSKIPRLQGNTDSDTIEIDFGNDGDEMYIKNEMDIEEVSGETDIEV